MLKFQSIDSYLSTVPEDCEFTIELTLKEGSFIKFNDNVSQDVSELLIVIIKS